MQMSARFPEGGGEPSFKNIVLGEITHLFLFHQRKEMQALPTLSGKPVANKSGAPGLH